MSVDPHEGYRSAVTNLGLLADVTIVVDPFHIVRLANAAVTKTASGCSRPSYGIAGGRATRSTGSANCC